MCALIRRCVLVSRQHVSAYQDGVYWWVGNMCALIRRCVLVSREHVSAYQDGVYCWVANMCTLIRTVCTAELRTCVRSSDGVCWWVANMCPLIRTVCACESRTCVRLLGRCVLVSREHVSAYQDGVYWWVGNMCPLIRTVCAGESRTCVRLSGRCVLVSREHVSATSVHVLIWRSCVLYNTVFGVASCFQALVSRVCTLVVGTCMVAGCVCVPTRPDCVARCLCLRIGHIWTQGSHCLLCTVVRLGGVHSSLYLIVDMRIFFFWIVI